MPGTPGPLTTTLRSPLLRRALLAYLAFNVAELATWIALLVWAYDDGGLRAASLIALVQLLPAAALAPLVVRLQARVGPGRALRAGYLAQAATQAGVATALLCDAASPWVFALAAACAVAITSTRPAHNELLPRLSATTGELTAGTALSGSAEASATFVGPALGGAILATAGPGGVFALTAALLAVGAALAPTRTAGGGSRPDRAPSPSRAGVRDVVGHREARVLCLLAAAVFVLVGTTDLLVVVLALDVLDLDAGGPGLLSAALGVGGIAGAALTFGLIGRARLRGPLVLGAVVAGAGMAAAGAAGSVPLTFAVLAACGAGTLLFDVTCRTFVQRVLSDRMLGAVFGVNESLMMGGLALGSVLAPVLVEAVGARAAFAVAGALLPLTALAVTPALRRMDESTTIPLDVLDSLSRVPALSPLAPRVLERLALEAERLDVAPGTRIVVEGEAGQHFYLLAEGTAVVTRDGAVVRTIGPGDWFGELALLREVPRTASVTAQDAVVAYAVDRDAFLASVGADDGALDVVEEHEREHYV